MRCFCEIDCRTSEVTVVISLFILYPAWACSHLKINFKMNGVILVICIYMMAAVETF